jgi:hypothetical protein
MAQARMIRTRQAADAAVRAREARRLFFKADRPRAIDGYIDYFGGAGGVMTSDDDPCGETLLERLA